MKTISDNWIDDERLQYKYV